jgi:glycosyltransferase involved in cell wall biosynthesis
MDPTVISESGGSKIVGDDPSATHRVLMVAFHYPPCFGSSGVHRTLKFSRYLPEFGWKPVVLSAHPAAYEHTSPGQLSEIPLTVPVTRSFALDGRRHLAIRGKSLSVASLPDQWASWWLTAVPTGLRLIRQHRPDVIWSTYPIATAHLIGLTLHRLTGIPWVADLRDVMTDHDYPVLRATRRIYRWIERRTMANAARVVFTAPSARRLYRERYPGLSDDRSLLIVNGYDEDDFNGVVVRGRPDGPEQPIRLLHAGLIYEHERDPRFFFRALARLFRDGVIRPDRLRVDLRAAGSEAYFSRQVMDLGLQEFVRLLPPLPYREALQDCAEASALLILQGPSCDGQIPAKVYEYLRLGKPILALTSEQGDTARLLRETGGATIVDLLGEDAIYRALPSFLAEVARGKHPVPERRTVSQYARYNQARELARCLSRLVGSAKSSRL